MRCFHMALLQTEDIGISYHTIQFSGDIEKKNTSECHNMQIN